MNQFIISDDPDILRGLRLFEEQLNSEFLTFNQVIENPHLLHGNNKFIKTIFILSKDTFLHRTNDIRKIIRSVPEVMPQFLIRAPLEEDVFSQAELDKDLYFANIPEGSPAFFIAKNIINAFTLLQYQIESFEHQYKVNLSTSHITKLTRIGMSLATEKDFTKLLREILYSAREICVADAGSLYLVEKDEEGKPKNLRFKISALDLNSNEFLLPINKQSIAGYVAYTGKVLNIPDVYHLPPDVEYKFNSEFDKIKNYYSKSMLVVPMKNHSDEVIGVIQLINKKKFFHQKLTLEMMKGPDVMPFDKYSEELVLSVAGQAAVAIQNNNLIQDIERLFEGFVTASVSAIEARDPTTSGHSFRVAELTVGLAETVDKLTEGRFRDVSFTREQIKEIRYASLLHDFGKVGVREKVLVKAKKLETYEMDIIKWRFSYLLKLLEEQTAQKKIDYLKRNGSIGFADYEASLNFELENQKRKLYDWFELIKKCNEPTVLEETSSHLLEEISKVSFPYLDGNQIQLITPKELNFLSIKKGSLDFEERKEIESHVQHT
ncbi:MAG: GAF domain-containing protein, partial [Leptospiraceae bacterium]|nr:GAF domain-containing protein [Leptospiraceae bacterium]